MVLIHRRLRLGSWTPAVFGLPVERSALLLGGESVSDLTHSERWALVNRADLLESECAVVREQRINWHGRKRQTEGMGRGGGSALDRRLIIEAMAKLEAR